MSEAHDGASTPRANYEAGLERANQLKLNVTDVVAPGSKDGWKARRAARAHAALPSSALAVLRLRAPR